MSAKAVSEASGKNLLNSVLTTAAKSRFASINESSNFDAVLRENPWLANTVSCSWDKIYIPNSSQSFSLKYFVQKLVVKPDQLIKRRGKLGLILVNADYSAVKDWIQQRIGKDTQVCDNYNSWNFLFIAFSCKLFLKFHYIFPVVQCPWAVRRKLFLPTLVVLSSWSVIRFVVTFLVVVETALESLVFRVKG